LILVSWLLWQIPQATQTAASYRPYTLEQSILTQPRILLEYLGLLFFPRPYTNGLFNDAFPFSQDFWHPWTTVPSILIIIALIVTAWKFRQRFPIPAFSVLFFFAGHMLESTLLPLELYFEHRNYVPALLLFWPLATALADTRLLGHGLKLGITLAIVALLALFTWMRAGLWGNGEQQALLWAIFNPDSARAQTYAAQYDISKRKYTAAIQRLEAVNQNRPDSVQAVLNLISAKCALDTLSDVDLQKAELALSTSKRGRTILLTWVQSVLKAYSGNKHCNGLNHTTLTRLLNAAADNPQFQSPGGKQDITYLRGLVALHFGRQNEALAYFKEAMKIQPKPEVILELSAEFARRNHLQETLSLLRYGRTIWEEHESSAWNMQALHNRILHEQGFWEHEFLHLEKVLQEHLETRQSDNKLQQPTATD